MDLVPFGFNPFGENSPFFQGGFPRIDVQETAKDVVVIADMPGIDPKKINVEIGDKSIKLSGSVHEEKESKGKNFYRKERSSQSFERIIPLPAPVKSDGVKAVAKNGTLTITLPKQHPQEVKMRKIPVEEQ